MSRYVVVVNTDAAIAAQLGTGVITKTVTLGEQKVKVVRFDDETEGQAFSHTLNGTVYRQEWAADDHARHKIHQDA